MHLTKWRQLDMFHVPHYPLICCSSKNRMMARGTNGNGMILLSRHKFRCYEEKLMTTISQRFTAASRALVKTLLILIPHVYGVRPSGKIGNYDV